MANLEYRLAELAEAVDGVVRGDADRVIRGVSTLERATPDELSFLTNQRYRKQVDTTRAGALLVPPGSGVEGRDLIEVAEPYPAFAQLLELFHPPPPREPGIAATALLDPSVRVGQEAIVAPFAVLEAGVVLGDRVTIGAGVVVGRECVIGDDSELKPRVVLYPRSRVGARCLIHAGVVLGGDGYGFATSNGKHRKVPQLGRVVVEDDVEIGANCTIDRGTLDDTRIGRGSKIDNLVMIAHGVDLGEDSLLAAQSGIAGSTRVGDRVTFAGQSGAAGHLTIAAGTVVGAKSAVLQDVPRGGFIAGIPAVDHRDWKRSQASLRRLPELLREVRRLRDQVAELERRLADDDRS